MTKEQKSQSAQPNYDLSEEASRRSGKGATETARRLESDDANEETGIGPVDRPDDSLAQDRVWTSSIED